MHDLLRRQLLRVGRHCSMLALPSRQLFKHSEFYCLRAMCGRKLLHNRREHDVCSVRGNNGLISAKLNLVLGVCRWQLLVSRQRDGVCGLLSRQLLLRRRQCVLTVFRRQLLRLYWSNHLRRVSTRKDLAGIQCFDLRCLRGRQLFFDHKCDSVQHLCCRQLCSWRDNVQSMCRRQL
jgi:hypothetical protein